MTHFLTHETVSRRTALRTVFPIALVGFGGCLGGSGSDTNENTVESRITVLNRSDSEHDILVHVHNDTLDKQILEETASIPPGERKRWDITTEGDDGTAKLLGTLLIENPIDDIADDDDVDIMTIVAGASDASAFSGQIREDGSARLTTDQV